ncbi:hypothetical protein I8D64_07775 [Brachybacterium sp. MASK1Z-5]|uniref:DUF3329 domain-containing protein n=1 Tax=Brachybacterium halotolerans TaxID=2795215 RepID=A0ABS1B9G4_9MICO|nr:hypothetical protein [Brachybacterium halotolerans]MBK0331299.1 hypothetical protein [Brachybacterium halotolerans]
MSRDGLRLLWLKVVARPAVLVVLLWLWWPGERLLHSWMSQLSLVFVVVASTFWLRLFIADLRALAGGYRQRDGTLGPRGAEPPPADD